MSLEDNPKVQELVNELILEEKDVNDWQTLLDQFILCNISSTSSCHSKNQAIQPLMLEPYQLFLWCILKVHNRRALQWFVISFPSKLLNRLLLEPVIWTIRYLDLICKWTFLNEEEEKIVLLFLDKIDPKIISPVRLLIALLDKEILFTEKSEIKLNLLSRVKGNRNRKPRTIKITVPTSTSPSIHSLITWLYEHCNYYDGRLIIQYIITNKKPIDILLQAVTHLLQIVENPQQNEEIWKTILWFNKTAQTITTHNKKNNRRMATPMVIPREDILLQQAFQIHIQAGCLLLPYLSTIAIMQFLKTWIYHSQSGQHIQLTLHLLTLARNTCEIFASTSTRVKTWLDNILKRDDVKKLQHYAQLVEIRNEFEYV